MFIKQRNTDTAESLSLKSSAPNASASSAQKSEQAVLCTDDQTYQVRLVHTSNSVFVLQPSENSLVLDGNSSPSSNLSAIAQCAATLELAPAAPSATTFLKQCLPVYRGPKAHTENEARSQSLSGSAGKVCRQTILENAPFSLAEFERSWEELCAFEEEGQAWLPAASSLINVWKSILTAATIRSVKLEESFALTTLRGAVEEDEHPRALFDAVVYRLRSPEVVLTERSRDSKPS